MKNILVTGASGHLGQLVIQNLLKTYKGQIIAGSRNLEKIQNLKSQGVELREIDFDKPETLEKGFAGVEKVLIISTDALAVPGLRLKQHTTAVDAAKKVGVKHIAYTSINNPGTIQLSFAPDHKGSEEAIKNSGLNYTILRNNWYMQNMLPALKQALETGKYYTSMGTGKVGYVSREDCARVAAAALVSDKLPKAVIDVTNEVSLSGSDLAKILSEVSGKSITHVDITEEELRKNLAGAGLPPFVVDLFATYEKTVKAGGLDVTNGFVKELTGQSPISMRDFLKKEIGG